MNEQEKILARIHELVTILNKMDEDNAKREKLDRELDDLRKQARGMGAKHSNHKDMVVVLIYGGDDNDE